MRTIKFRGKTNSGKWIYSDGILQADIPDEGGTIETVQLWEEGEGWVYVEPATVGQFTGLYDINGVEIYEGDILQGLYCGVFFRLVYWDDALCGFALKDDYVEPIGYVNIDKFNYIVVGNEWDTPELLEVRE